MILTGNLRLVAIAATGAPHEGALAMALFDWRRPWPLLIVAFLHVLFFYALQAGLLRRMTEAPAMREVMAALLAPEPPPAPPPPAQVEPPKPETAAQPMHRVAMPQPPALPPVNTTPSPQAITLSPVPERIEPAAVRPPPQPAAPAVTTAPLAPAPAPAVAVEAPPVVPPRLDAAYLNNPPPAYPAFSRRAGEQGKVMLRVHVSAQGSADEVTLGISSGFPRLDETALATVRQWRFVPARQGEQAVAAWVLVPVTFRLEG